MIRVLIAEDEISAAKMLGEVLELEGFTVTLAPNGKRALEMIDEVQPELIITDYMMPVMNGIEMAKAVRAMPAFANVPILVTSGVPEKSLMAESSAFTAFLRKPFSIDVLLEVIGKIVSNPGPK
jgi:two-component system response regulator VicR